MKLGLKDGSKLGLIDGEVEGPKVSAMLGATVGTSDGLWDCVDDGIGLNVP